MQIYCSARSVTCSLNSVYRPHWLVEWSHHCSHMCIPVHSPWLPGYVNIVQTVLVTLTVDGLFPDRPEMQGVWHIVGMQQIFREWSNKPSILRGHRERSFSVQEQWGGFLEELLHKLAGNWQEGVSHPQKEGTPMTKHWEYLNALNLWFWGCWTRLCICWFMSQILTRFIDLKVK